MASTIYVGLSLTSHGGNTLNTAMFSNVTLTGTTATAAVAPAATAVTVFAATPEAKLRSKKNDLLDLVS